MTARTSLVDQLLLLAAIASLFPDQDAIIRTTPLSFHRNPKLDGLPAIQLSSDAAIESLTSALGLSLYRSDAASPEPGDTTFWQVREWLGVFAGHRFLIVVGEHLPIPDPEKPRTGPDAIGFGDQA